jgi:hypothetical protein
MKKRLREKRTAQTHVRTWGCSMSFSSLPDYLNEREHREAVAVLLEDSLELPAAERVEAFREAIAELSESATYVVPELGPPDRGLLSPAEHRMHVAGFVQRALDGPADEWPETINLAVVALRAAGVRRVEESG